MNIIHLALFKGSDFKLKRIAIVLMHHHVLRGGKKGSQVKPSVFSTPSAVEIVTGSQIYILRGF